MPTKSKHLSPQVPFPEYSHFDAVSIAAGSFTFLNVPAEYGAKILWGDKKKSRLWRYNLHYFNYLLAQDQLPFSIGLPLVRDWIQGNPPGTPDAWDPFPISLRIVNWVKYLRQNSPDQENIRDIFDSLNQQALWLEKSVEHHLLANHLFKNAKALLFAGLFFEGPDAARWRAEGTRLLSREIPEQVLPDGGHFERSPMYHSMILEDCLDLYNLCAQRPGEEFRGLADLLRAAIPKMALFLRGLAHPDGQIALFNDAAFGIELPPGALLRYQERLLGARPEEPTGPLWGYPATGYYVMAPSADRRLIVDCGDVGPAYQPGHSHCDALSFELSLKGRRVIVDSGCFGYEPGPLRDYNRGNAGHNTVTIDGTNQSEVWGAHRCGRRARPLRARLEKTGDGGLLFAGAHDGYRHLTGGPIHSRRIEWRADICLIEDEIDGTGRHDIESRLHIHPALRIENSADAVKICDEVQDLLAVSTKDGGGVAVENGWYCPEFGKRLPCKVLVQKYENRSLPFKLGWRFLVSG
jgi:uncharacterized heparinase superfamily protein